MKSRNNISKAQEWNHIIPTIGSPCIKYIIIEVKVTELYKELTIKNIKKFFKYECCYDVTSKSDYLSFNLINDQDLYDSIFIEYHVGNRYSCDILTVEFSPDTTDLNFLRICIDKIYPAKYKGFVANGIVSKIDIDIELLNTNITDIIAVSTDRYYEFVNYYEGSAYLKGFWCLDDKSIYLLNKFDNQDGNSHASNIVIVSTKISLRNKEIALNELCKLDNPLESLYVICSSELNILQETDAFKNWDKFLDCCRLKSVSCALVPCNI